MKQIIFEKAHVKGVRFKIGNQAVVGFVEMVGKLTPQIADALGAKWSCYDKDGLPKSGFTKIELDAELIQCKVRLEVTGAANFVLDLTSPTINKFAVVRVGGKKKAKSTYLAMKFLCGVVGREQELIAFLKTAGMADGVLTIEEHAPQQTTIPGADGNALQQAVATVAGKGMRALAAEKPIALDTKLANVAIQLHEQDGGWHTDVVVIAGTAKDAVTTKVASAIGQSSRAAALVEALDKVAGWARVQGRKSAKTSVQDGAKEIVAWCADRMGEIKAASDLAQALAAPITFAERMRAAKTADEGRDILHDHEQAIHSLMTDGGLEPLCGPHPRGYKGFSVTTPKERKAAIKDLRLKDMAAGDRLHDLIAEGEAMRPLLDALHTKEMARGFGKPAPEDDAIPGAEAEAGLNPLRVLEFDQTTHRAAIRVGTVRDGSEAIDYEVAAVADADQAEPIVFSWTSHGVAFETVESAVIAAAKELERWGKKLMSDSPKRSALETQGRGIAAWAGGVREDAEGILARRPGRREAVSV